MTMNRAAKTLDEKLARIAADSSCRDFILADAKDADMAFGISAPGPRFFGGPNERQFRSLTDFREQIREIVRQGLVDIMLMSVSTSEFITIRERQFDDSHVTPAIRANDSTDIWLAGSGFHYGEQPSLPFRTASIDLAMCGHELCEPNERKRGADLGLYSITFNNVANLDRDSLDAYRGFRIEAEQKGFRHFLEVFAPNAPSNLQTKDFPRFINSSIARLLAGIGSRGRPLFIKMPYLGPAALEELVAYDGSLIVGILGASAGTTLDAFHLLFDAKKHGARAALFGRKINFAEHQLTFVQYLSAIARDEIQPTDAVRAYHADLSKLNLVPHRSLSADLILTQENK